MAKNINEQLWVRVLELEKTLKDQEKQTKHLIAELKQQHISLANYFQGLCLLCSAAFVFVVFVLIK